MTSTRIRTRRGQVSAKLLFTVSLAAAGLGLGAGYGFWGGWRGGSGGGGGGGEVPANRGALVPQSADHLGDGATEVVYLEQNWTPKESTDFYASPHGSRLIPYTWFLALEQPDNENKFTD